MCFVRMRRAEISKFNPDELKSYEDSVNAYRDIVNAIRTAEKKKYAEGLAEGRATEKTENARRFLAMGLSPQQVADGTGLTLEEIMKLINR